MPTPFAPAFRIPQCAEPSPKPDTTQEEGTNSSDNLELTHLLTIVILSFKSKLSQVGKIKLFVAELYSVLCN